MRAITQNQYGPPLEVLSLQEIDRPPIGPGDVLVEVQAASVNPADWHLVRGEPLLARASMGLRHPKDRVPGSDLAGTVVEVGAEVAEVHPGDQVFGSTFNRGCGAFAEYATVPSTQLAPAPRSIPLEAAATIPMAALTALEGLRDQGRITPDHHVLVIGASGGIGTFAVQLAKSFGAEVTGVCSTPNVELVRSLGADHVIDYTTNDVTRSSQRYDLILLLGGRYGPRACRRVMTERGTLCVISGDSPGRVVGPIGRVLRTVALSPFVSQKLTVFTVKPNRADLETLGGLVDSGDLTPIVEQKFALSEVPHAIARVEQGHTRGKIAVTR